MKTLQRKDNKYYCFKKAHGKYEKYVQARTIDFYDKKGRLGKELEYYRWTRDLELSAIRAYVYDIENRLICEEVRHVKASMVEKRYHILDRKGLKIKTLVMEFDVRGGGNRVKDCHTIDYIYDQYGRLEKDIMNLHPRHYSETKYFYRGKKSNPFRKEEYLQLGKGNRWWTTYHYDDDGRLKKELRSYKKGPMAGRSFTMYYYARLQKICITSDGERTVTIFNKNLYSSKWYDSNGALTRYTVMKEENGINVVRSWEYACDCYGVVVYPVFLSVTKYKYRK